MKSELWRHKVTRARTMTVQKSSPSITNSSNCGWLDDHFIKSSIKSRRCTAPLSCCPSLRSSTLIRIHSDHTRRRRFDHLLKRTSIMMIISKIKEAVETTQKGTNCSGLLHKLNYIKVMVLGYDLLVVLAAASIATYFVATKIGSQWLSFISESKPFISTAGAFYSFALVFRTNICYSRWWEGRCLWGALIVCAIRIAQQARLWINDPSLIDRINYLTITFAYCSKAQLRGARIEDEAEYGNELVKKGIITKKEMDIIATQNGWQPFYCLDAMRAVVSEGLKVEDMEGGWKMNAAQAAMEDTIASLSNCIGGSLRVKSTGLPLAFDLILNAVGALFFTAACLAWAPSAGFYNPIIVLVAYIMAKVITRVGTDMEDPFGYDASDLNLELFCELIYKQIIAVDERSELITYDLARGPGSNDLDEETGAAAALHSLPSSTSASVGQ